MHPQEEFRRHAAECGYMASFLRDPKSKATWKSMAERWLRCAEWYENTHPPLYHHRRREQSRRRADLDELKP